MAFELQSLILELLSGSLGWQRLGVLLTPSVLTDCSQDVGRSCPEAGGEDPP